MPTKSKDIAEVVSILFAIYFITIVFVLAKPYVFTEKVAVPIKILFELSPYLLMVGLIVLISKRNRVFLSKNFGFKTKPLLKQLLISTVIFAITISFIVVPLLLGVNKNDVLSFKAQGPLIFTYYFVKSIFIVGMGEELVWRGYFYEKIKEITGTGIWSVILSSILFGLWHYPSGQDILQVLMVTGLGLIYGFARLKINYCTTFATGIAHGLHDAMILLLSYIIL